MKTYAHGALPIVPQEGSSLPRLIELQIRIARKLDCLVSSMWEGTPILVSPQDTFQGVQTRVLAEKRTRA